MPNTEKERILFYNESYTQYRQDGGIVVDPMCNAWTVINIGTTVAHVNGVPLNPGVPGTSNGESWANGGNRGEIFIGRVDLRFDTGAGVVIFIQKFYEPTYPRSGETI